MSRLSLKVILCSARITGGDVGLEAWKTARRLGLHPTPCHISEVNGFRTFILPPDESKDGQEEADEAERRRALFIAYVRQHLCDEDGSSALSLVEVEYGGDLEPSEAQIRAAGMPLEIRIDRQPHGARDRLRQIAALGADHDGGLAGKTKLARWSMLGQAMPPGLAEAVARQVAAQLAGWRP